jgi:glycosyltransferase involved in cell wall biosynthesis
MPEPASRPLVTFAVFACNQEKFVREAVEAAFAQTYSPLEIILSDDCSDDRTFEIVREMAAAYRGPHEIILNRNPFRRSIGGHFNRVVELARGELIVVQAADDISLAERTQLAYDAWERSGRKATSLHSDFIQIDENSREIEAIYRNEEKYERGQLVSQKVEPVVYAKTLKPILFGCTHAFCRKLYRIFGNLPEDITHEDDILAFRSVLVDGLFYINQPLVKYRLHGANMYLRSGKGARDLKSIEQQESRMRRDFRNRETMYSAFLLDLKAARKQELIGKVDFEKAFEEAERLHRQFLLMGGFLESGLLSKWRIFLQLRRIGINENDRKFLTSRLVPRSLFLRIKLLRSYLSGAKPAG